MSQHVPVPCENCGRELLIQAHNLGRIGKCKYCGYVFRAQLESIFELPPSPPSRSSAEEEESIAAKRAPTSELAQQRGLPMTKAGGSSASRRRRDRGSRRASVRDLGTHSPADSVAAPASASFTDDTPLACDHGWEEVRAAMEASPAALSALRDRADEIARLKKHVQAEFAEIAQLRARIEEERSLAHLSGAPSTQENAEQFAALRRVPALPGGDRDPPLAVGGTSCRVEFEVGPANPGVR